MTLAYVRRYLKLLPTRFIRFAAAHALPTLVVLFLLGFSLSLPLVIQPQEIAPSAPVSGISKINPLASTYVLPTSNPPEVSAKNIFIQNQDTGQIILSRSADDPIYPASTTKIVTGLITLKHFSLDQVITVSREYKEGQRVGFQPGEQITVENLLYALLIDSANDAAEILAENYPGGRSAFVSEMNNYVYSLGLKHTNFKNPTGLDEPGHFSSASDLARLAAQAMDNPLISRIVSTESAVVTSIDQSQSHIIANTNELLGKVPGVLGLKTGFTDLAGQSLVTVVSRDGHRLVFVVMGSEDRFGETKRLIEWAYSPQ